MIVWTRWRQRRDCWHHNRATRESWITGVLIDLGRRKMWTCSECGRRWVT